MQNLNCFAVLAHACNVPYTSNIFENAPDARYRERSYKVEPMQGLVKDIFELDRCWMRGNSNNRWIFAAMGLTVQMHQLQAFKQGRSTWNIKELVLG